MNKLNKTVNKIRLLYAHLTQAFAYFTRSVRISSYPLVFNIEPTNHCPMDCKMCPRRHMSRKQGHMKLELFKRIIDQIKVYDNQIWLHHFGDPLVHPQFPDMVRYCHQRGISINCSANPTLLNDALSEKLIDSGLDNIYLSLDSIDDRSYKDARGGSANYDRAVSGIMGLIKLKNSKCSITPRVTVGLIYMKSTEKYIDKFKGVWDIPGVDAVCIKPFTGFGLDALLDQADESTVRKIKNKSVYPCLRLWRSVTILWDGSVVPCCYDYDARYIIGNLNDCSLESIWNNPRMLDLRKQNILNVFSGEGAALCGNCAERYGWPSFREPVKLSSHFFRKFYSIARKKY